MLTYLCRVLAVQVAQENRRNILADLLTVYANAGKTIVFTETKREADEVAGGIAGVIPSEVSTPRPPASLHYLFPKPPHEICVTYILQPQDGGQCD